MQYCSCGLTKDWYASAVAFMEEVVMFCLMNPKVLLALVFTLAMCLFQVRLCEMSIPRYVAWSLVHI